MGYVISARDVLAENAERPDADVFKVVESALKPQQNTVADARRKPTNSKSPKHSSPSTLAKRWSSDATLSTTPL